CIKHGKGSRLSIVEGADGQIIRTIDAGYPSISDDGTRLAYIDGDNQVVCLDIDSGRVLYRGPGIAGALYANGRYLGIVRDGHEIIIDVDHQQPVSGPADANIWICAMSPEGDRMVYYDGGKVWQTSPVRMIDDGHRDNDGIADCIFVCGGNKIAW